MQEEQPKLVTSDALDWFLQHLVSMTNQFQLFFPITLSVGGVLISGEIVDGKTYFDEFAGLMKQGLLNISGEQFATHMGDIYRSAGDRYLQSTAESEERPAISEPNYIHLRKAKIFHAGGASIPRGEGVLWRVRLGAIDGFTLGSLSLDEPLH